MLIVCNVIAQLSAVRKWNHHIHNAPLCAVDHEVKGSMTDIVYWQVFIFDLAFIFYIRYDMHE